MYKTSVKKSHDGRKANLRLRIVKTPIADTPDAINLIGRRRK